MEGWFVVDVDVSLMVFLTSATTLWQHRISKTLVQYKADVNETLIFQQDAATWVTS